VHIPTAWDKATLFDELMKYCKNEKTFVCPASPRIVLIIASFGTLSNQEYPWLAPFGDYLMNYAYVAGLADPRVLAGGAPYPKWYDAPPSATTLRIGVRNGKVMVTDVNFYAIGEGWMIINHARGGAFGSAADIVPRLTGSNRLYNDGHVEWVDRGRMGRNETPLTLNPTDARYSTGFDIRPYWW
jgi:hypothetical protein